MFKTRHKYLAALGKGILAAVVIPFVAFVQAQTVVDDEAQWRALEQYCQGCHNFEDFAGSIAFDIMSPDDIPMEADVWEKVIRKLRGGMMPPPGHDRPDQKQSANLIAWLENTIDTAAQVHQHPGEIALHRLNRREYQRAVEDLLHIEFDASFLLPIDDVSDGFDNIANVLQVSPSFIDQYLNAARVLSGQALGLNAERETLVTLSGKPATDQANHIDGLPLGTRGGLLVEHEFPADAEYVFRLGVRAREEVHEYRVLMLIDGELVYETHVGGPEDLRKGFMGGVAASREINSRFEDIRLPLTAGKHEVGVTFVSQSFQESQSLLHSYSSGGSTGPTANSIEIRGPLNVSGSGTIASREKIFTCYPSGPEQEEACAEQIIRELATQAFRKPVNNEAIAGPLHFYRTAREQENFEAGIQNAIMAILASPSFLYRIETPDEKTEPGAIFALDGLELASRLSFFLWSSLPDQVLLDLATSGELEDEAVLLQQVERMLNDPRAEALVSNFAFQWLDVNKIAEADPDPSIFPGYSAALGAAFQEEMRLFLSSVLLADKPITALLTADYSFVNERLARHYGINDVLGNRFRKVTLEDENRWGLLGKGSILLTTSYPNRTAPVLRGAWILERITGTPPNAPPPNVEALKETGSDGQALTMRELMAQHAANPSCHSCHGVMDPLGLALDNFDAVGRWQEFDRYARSEIDASGQLPDGTPLAGPADLRQALTRDPEQFTQTVTEKLMTYALGRSVEHHDMPAVRQIVSEAKAEDYSFKALIKGIVRSDQFRLKQLAGSSDNRIALHNESKMN